MFLEAKSKRDLVAAMLDNNRKRGAFFRYFDIQKDGPKWVCWYYVKLSMLPVKKNGA